MIKSTKTLECTFIKGLCQWAFAILPVICLGATDKNFKISTKDNLLTLRKNERKLVIHQKRGIIETIRRLEARKAELEHSLQSQIKKVREVLQNSILSSKVFLERKEPPTFSSGSISFEHAFPKLWGNFLNTLLEELNDIGRDKAKFEDLEVKILTERHQLEQLAQDLLEQENILTLNQKLKPEKRVDYRRIKETEFQIESLISDFNEKRVLKEVLQTGMKNAFANMRGQLPWPVMTKKPLTSFGKNFDLETGLFVFKKGVDLLVKNHEKIQAVFSGKIAYSGSLPNYGFVTIVDHGNHFYTLLAHLGEILKSEGELVYQGDAIGISDDAGTPIYFEIRVKNVAVNPLQWMMN